MLRHIEPDRKNRNFLVLLLLVVLSATYGCDTNSNSSVVNTDPSPEIKLDKIKVVTTVLPVYLFTQAVTGDVADVKILVPSGTDIHEYQGTLANVRAIATAKILIKNGLGLEEFLAEILHPDIFDYGYKNTGWQVL